VRWLGCCSQAEQMWLLLSLRVRLLLLQGFSLLVLVPLAG
jgi:hypothetical protein